MATDDKPSLVELAKSHKSKGYRKRPDDGSFNERLDLALARVRGEVTTAQCAHALSCGQNSVGGRISSVIVTALRRGVVTIIDNRKEPLTATGS